MTDARCGDSCATPHPVPGLAGKGGDRFNADASLVREICGKRSGLAVAAGEDDLVGAGAALGDVLLELSGVGVGLGQLDKLRSEGEPASPADARGLRCRGAATGPQESLVAFGGTLQTGDQDDQTGNAGDAEGMLGSGARRDAQVVSGAILDDEGQWNVAGLETDRLPGDALAIGAGASTVTRALHRDAGLTQPAGLGVEPVGEKGVVDG